MKELEKILLIFAQLERAGKLVGAGRTASVTVGAFKARDNVVDSHSLDERAYTLCVAVTAAREMNAAHDPVVDFKIDSDAAHSLRLVCKPCHNHSSYIVLVPVYRIYLYFSSISID